MNRRKPIIRVLHTVTTLVVALLTVMPLNLLWVLTAEAGNSVRVAPSASLNVPRVGHTATALPDGSVLVAGGENADGLLASVELFLPATNAFVIARELLTARSGHTATRLEDGRVLIAGGRGGTGPLNSAEIYDPAAQSSQAVGPMTAARTGHTATRLLNGQVLLAGGDTAGTAELFDPATGTFARLGNLAQPRSGHSATLFADDSVLLAGGGNDTAEFFDATNHTFTLVPRAMTVARTDHAAVATALETVLLLGGDPGNTVETFDPATDTFTATAASSNAMASATLLANERILVLGLDWTGVFSPVSSNQWEALTDTNATTLLRAGHTATELATNKQIFVVGGLDSSNQLIAATAMFNPAWVATDRDDYPPLTFVDITGGGFRPGETVSNQVVQVEGPAAGTAYNFWAVVADTNGEFSTTWLVFTEDLLNTTLELTAAGQTSGLMAKTRFTDGTANDGQGTMSVNVTAVCQGSSGNSFTFTFDAPNGKDFNSGSQISVDVPSGWTTPQTTSSGSPGYVSSSVGTIAVASRTITVTLTAKLSGGSSFTISYGGGGGAVTAPGTPGANTFTTKSKSGSGGTLTAIATSPSVTVNATSVGGTASPTAPEVCSGTGTTIGLSGRTGNIVKWQSSPNGTTWSDIASTANPYSTGNLTATTYFRAVVQSGTCGTANSTAAQVTVDPTSVGGTASPTAAEICNGTGTTIALAGQTGSIVKWQSSPNGTTWSDIASTANPYSTGNLTATTYFRAVVQSGACSTANSTAAQVIVDPASVGGTANPTAAHVCSGTGTTIALAGQTGSIVKWQSSPDNSTWTDIASTANPYSTGNLTVTTYFRAVVQSGACSTANSTAAQVTVDPGSVGGTASATTPEICSGTSTTISLTGQTGNIVKWQSSPNGTTWSDIVSTANPYSTGNLTATTYFRAVVQSGTCGTANSTAAQVTVDPASVGGTASPTAAHVCSGTATTIALAGQTGSIVKWQSSPDGTTWTDIASTANPYSTGNLTAATFFRAVVQSGTCGSANSTAAQVTVDPASVGGTASPTAAHVCSGTGTTIALAGQTGSIVKWQSSPDNSTWTDIVSTANPYSTGNLTATTYFRAVVQSGACGSANSTAAQVTVDPASVGGSASATAPEICSGTGTTIALAGQTGTIVKWQSSPNGTTWTDIASTTNPYSTGNLTATTYFRAVVQSGACGTANSTAAQVTVDPASVGGTANPTAAHVCSGTATTIALSGQTGSIVKWQSSPDNSTWTDIASTANPFSTGNLTATTYFRAVVQSGTCGSANSTAAQVTVDPASVGGTASPTAAHVCSGTGTTIALAGQTGTIVKWQSSPNGTTWTDIASTANPYSTGNLTATTFFRAVVQSGTCGTANSAAAQVTVDPASVGGTANPTASHVCNGTATTIALAGQTGTIVKWQSSPDNSTWTDIASTANPYSTGNLTAATYFRAVVQSGTCGTANSAAAQVTVDPASVGGSASATAPEVCSGTGTTIALSGQTGNIVKWQSSPDSSTWTDIASTANPYPTANLTATTYFRAVVQSGTCGAANSTAAQVTVDPASVGGTASPTAAHVCSGTATTIALAGQTGSIVKWQSSPNGTTWTDIASTANPYPTANLTATTYFRAVVQSGTCGTANSAAAQVTVDPASVGGTASPTAAHVCSGTATTIALAGQTGSIVKWQSSPDNSTWTDIASTASPYSTGNLTATTYFRAVVQSGTCGTANSAAAQVTVDPASVGGTASPTASHVCTGTATTISLSGQTGNIVKWQSSPNGTTWTDIASTANPYPTGNLTATTFFRAVVQSGTCGTANSAAAQVTVDPASVGGTASPAASHICDGTGTTIALAGQTGSIVKWQSSPDNSTWTDIASTANPYSTGNLTATTYFRAVVQSGTCGAANSTAAQVTVDPASVGGTASATASPVCSGTGTTIGLSGQTGNIVKWQSSPDNSTWTDIASTANPLSTGNLTAATYFRAVVQSGACSTAISSAAQVSINPASVGGTATAGDATLCSGTGTTIALNGQAGDIVKWQSSPNGTTWADIGSTANPYPTGNLTATTYFRAVVQNGTCATANSSAAQVTINPGSVGGTATPTDASVCNNSGTTVALSGQTGSIVKWQSSPDNSTWTDIASTANPYPTGNLTALTYFRAVVQSGICAPANSSVATVAIRTPPTASITGPDSLCQNTSANTYQGPAGMSSYAWTVTSGGSSGTVPPGQASHQNPKLNANAPGTFVLHLVVTDSNGCTGFGDKTITVNPTSVGGTAAATDATICSGSGTTIALSGQTGTIAKWQSSPDGTTWTDIASTANPYPTGNLTATTRFRAVVQSGACSTANSSAAQVTINAVSVGGTAAATDATLCSGGGTTIALSGQTGTLVKWQSSPDGTTWTDLASTANPYPTGNLSATTWYRAVVQSGVCVPASSSAARVTVNPTSVGGTAAATSTTMCSGNGTTITLSGQTGAIVKWQSSPDGTTWTDIASTANPLPTGNLTATTSFRAVVQSGVCTPTTSTSATVTVNPVPTAPTVGNDGPACVGSTLNLTASTVAGATYSWTGPNGFNSSQPNPSIASVTTAAAGQYSVVVTVNGCTSAPATTTVTVNALPAISAGPSDATRYVGDSAAFSVTATGTGLSYQWRKNGTNLSNGGTVSGATTATLTLTGVASSDSGATLDCVVSGTCPPAAISATATLTVNLSPVVTSQPASVTKRVGSAATFSVAATGQTPLSYQWRKNGVSIAGATSSTYSIPAVKSSDAATYDVVVKDAGGRAAASNAAALLADVTPQIAVTLGGFRYNAATQHYYQTHSLKNNGTATVNASTSVTLDSLSVPGALVNASGTTTAMAAPSGSPYLSPAAVSLAPGGTTTVTLELTRPCTYTLRFLGGPGSR